MDKLVNTDIDNCFLYAVKQLYFNSTIRVRINLFAFLMEVIFSILFNFYIQLVVPYLSTAEFFKVSYFSVY